MRASKVWFVPSVAILLLVAGCGGDDDSDAQPSEDDAATPGSVLETDEDDDAPSEPPTGSVLETEPDGGTADLTDFPIAVAEGGAVLADNTIEGDRGVLLEYPADDFDRLVDFYQEWTDADGADYTRIEAASGGIIFQNSDAEAFRSIIVSSPPDGGGPMLLTLTAGGTS